MAEEALRPQRRWLRGQAKAAWAERYARPAEEYHIPHGETARQRHSETVGCAGHALFAAVTAPAAPVWLREVPAVERVRQIWVQNFYLSETLPRRLTRGCAGAGLPRARQSIVSPYNPEMRYAKKRATRWSGYKVHLAESCDAERLHLITHVGWQTRPPPRRAEGAVAARRGEDQAVDRQALSGPVEAAVCLVDARSGGRAD